VYVSSESDSGHLPRDTRASAHCRDGQELTDEGHKADDETNARSGRREHQTDVNTPTDSIAFKELKRSMDDHGKVDSAYFLFIHEFINNNLSQGDNLCIFRNHIRSAVPTGAWARSCLPTAARSETVRLSTAPTQTKTRGGSAQTHHCAL
jgi:hypothetical protein